MITAIIPFRNWSEDRLERCVDHLRQRPAISEILVVDFGSDQPLAAPDGCRVVRVEADRWCLSEVNNIGISEAQNDVVLKIDADVQLLIENDTMAELAETVAEGSVALYVLQPTDFQYQDGVAVRKRLRPSWGEGCGNLFNRAAVIEIGGFDTRYFDYGGEDNDLCNRLRRYGKVVKLYQSDKLMHERHPPSAAQSKGQFSEAQKNALLAEGSIFRPNPFRYSNYNADSPFGPAITVAIATCDRPNRAQHLAHCLNGLKAQTFQDFEVRICENGSPPEARLSEDQLRQSFPELDIHLHQMEEPSIPKARNLITDHARGFYIAVHDDDDFSVPARFEEQLQCMAEHTAVHGCHSGWIEFDETDGQLTSYPGQERLVQVFMRSSGKVSLHGTALYRRDAMKRVRYDEDLVLSSDHHLHVAMMLAGLDVPHTHRYHCLRRLHAASVTNVGHEDQRGTSDRVNNGYKYFVGHPFLTEVAGREHNKPWVGGFPSIREILTYLPPEFGFFQVSLDMEAALSLGFDPLFGAEPNGGSHSYEGLQFVPSWQGYGTETTLAFCSTPAMSAGEVVEKLPAFAGVKGVDFIVDSVASATSNWRGLSELRVEKGHRRIVSRRFDTMMEALQALPQSILSAELGPIEFFAVNFPTRGVHILLNSYDDARELEHALSSVNSGFATDFFPVSDQGKRGSFHGT